MRGPILVLSMLLLVPVTGAWQLPEQPTLESEWVVIDEDGWTHAKWIGLRDQGLEPLRQISATEVLVWGSYGSYQLEIEPLLRGENSEGYQVVLEPRLPSYAQLEIISMFETNNLQLANTQSVIPTSFEVYGIDPSMLDGVPGIWWVEPLLETKARNSVSSSIMEHDSMENHPAWDLGLNGTGVIVGVADSGIELDHGCFRENATSIGEIGINHRKVVLVNTTIDDGDYPGQSDYRHGTHIAGSLGCELWNGNIIEGTSPSHGARILFQDVVNESGWSEPSVDWLLAEALANGAVIHSDSWGDDTEAYTLRSAEFDLWHREVPWSLAFIAPGNNPSKFYEPANARNVVSVGGTWTDNNSNLYSASSHGPTEEGLRGNFIVAPAMGITSAAADGSVSTFNDDLRASSGTSMSTPLGASITAVIQQMVQDGWFTEDGFVPSAPMLRALLAMSAESMEGGQQGSETVGPAPDPLQGWGRPNLGNLIDYNTNSTQNIWISDSYMMEENQRMMMVNSWLTTNGSRPLEQVIGSHWNGTDAVGPFLKNGESVGFELERIVGEDLDIFLSFNQRPFGTVSDDLDIFVTLPNGATFRSNDALEGTERLSIGSDVLGSVESVWVEVQAIHVGVGNHTDTLGVDGDMLGFGLAVKGVSGLVQPPTTVLSVKLEDGCLNDCSIAFDNLRVIVDGELIEHSEGLTNLYTNGEYLFEINDYDVNNVSIVFDLLLIIDDSSPWDGHWKLDIGLVQGHLVKKIDLNFPSGYTWSSVYRQHSFNFNLGDSSGDGIGYSGLCIPVQDSPHLLPCNVYWLGINGVDSNEGSEEGSGDDSGAGSSWDVVIGSNGYCTGYYCPSTVIRSIGIRVDGVMVHQFLSSYVGEDDVVLTDTGGIREWRHSIADGFSSVELEVEMRFVTPSFYARQGWWDYDIVSYPTYIWGLDFELKNGPATEEERVVRITSVYSSYDSEWGEHTFTWSKDAVVDKDGDGHMEPGVEHDGQCFPSGGYRQCLVYFADSHVWDEFPNNPSQWVDYDGDGFGDNSSGAWGDAFPLDRYEWEDADGDGFGDNYQDDCGDEWGNSTRGIAGCPDSDGDGYADVCGDFCNYMPGREEMIDACPFEFGLSWRDRIGCPDYDTDGWSDLNDDFPDDERYWIDTDSDGVDDSIDAFPNDVRRASSSDMIEPGIVVFFGMILIAFILAFIVPKNEDEIF